MKRLAAYILLAIIALSTTSSCQRDHLHYETNRLAMVDIEIDWSKTNLTPNGISAYIFDGAGDLYGDVVLSSNPNELSLKLPVGDYTVVMHNNSTSELKNVVIEGINRLETFSIHATESSDEPTIDLESNESFVNEPDDVASYTLRDIHIEAADVEYHYYKPDLADYEQTAIATYYATPRHIVHVTELIIYVEGVYYLRGTTKAILRGMSGGYYFDAECTSEEDVMEEFDVEVIAARSEAPAEGENGPSYVGDLGTLDGYEEGGWSDEDVEHMDILSVTYNTFGMHVTDPEDQRYYLDLRFYLYDNTYVDYYIDITDDLRTDWSSYNNIHTVEVVLDPIPDGGGEPSDHLDEEEETTGSSPMDPTVDEWVGTEVELPM